MSLLAGLSGCAVMGDARHGDATRSLTPPPPYYLRHHLDDPFSSIESATRRLSGQLGQSIETRTDQDLWRRTIDQFQFAQCDDDFPQAQAWAQWFAERPDYMNRVMDRAKPWLYDIVTEIERRQLPGELALLPVVESAYDPFAYSHGRAAGAWQFLATTAQSHGIQINDYYDGRRDVYVATRAALDYLTQLNRRFEGDWNLALAAYNGGQGRVARAIARNERANLPTDWQSLRLPRETKGYIPKLHGLACLFSSADEYGLSLPRWPYEPLVARIDLSGPTDVVVLSAMIGLEMDELLVLNPGLNKHVTSPTGPHHLIVPIHLASKAQEVVAQTAERGLFRYRQVQVQPGDSLSVIASRYQTSVEALKAHNRLLSDLIRVGDSLEIPSQMSAEQSQEFADRYQELSVLQSRLVPAKRFEHRVQPGESLWVIARRYQVSLNDLRRWNNLGQSHLIRPGQTLLVVLEPEQAASSSNRLPERYTVKNGDSLWTIARRHSIPLKDLMERNNLNAQSVLRPGQTLTLHTSVGTPE